MKQVNKTILRLVYGISVITLHQYYFLADGERSFGEGWEEDWREKVSNGSPSTLLSCGWWRFVWRRRERGLERGG
nr:hypothetical protein [uncultured Prevotella sp.]